MTYPFKTKPYPHQLEGWEQSREELLWAIFWEMGLGKTKLVVDSVGWLALRDKLDALLVIAPNGVHRNWTTDELPTHLPTEVPWNGVAYFAARAGTKTQEQALRNMMRFEGVAVLSMSYDGFTTDKGKAAAKALLTQRRTMIVFDESSMIKNPTAHRSRLALGAAPFARFRRILNGTPVSNSPFDVYQQMRILDENYWDRMGIPTFQVFQHHYGVMKRFQPAAEESGDGKKKRRRSWERVVAFKRLDELHERLKPLSTRLIKEDVLDLPPKLYTRRYFDMSEVQRKHYERLRLLFLTELDSGELVTANLAMVRLLRLQQVTCGYLKSEEEDRTVSLFKDGEENPRIRLLADTLEHVPHQAILWARFTEDINQMMALLNPPGEAPRAVRYDGPTSQKDRERALAMFHSGDAQFFVANPAAISMGVTLVEAKTVVYYNNDFSLFKRLQSEDRCHRIGQDRSVLYIDLCASGTVDERIVRALQAKYEVAAQVNGDRLREWLE